MKKFSYFFVFLLILNLIIFALSNSFLKKKNNITYQIFFYEPCALSESFENMILSYQSKDELFHKYWRKSGTHCGQHYRNSNYVFVFKNQNSKDQFLKEINSIQFEKKLESILNRKKLLLNSSLIFLRNFELIEKYKVTDDIKPILKRNEKILKEEYKEINELLNIISERDSIISIKQISKIKNINNFNLKFSIYITMHLFLLIIFFVFMIRSKQLGFYR